MGAGREGGEGDSVTKMLHSSHDTSEVPAAVTGSYSFSSQQIKTKDSESDCLFILTNLSAILDL